MSGTGGPLAAVPVHVFAATGGTYLTSVLTNAGGRYAFTLPAGSYKLLIQAPGYPDQWHDAPTYEGASAITLGPTKTVDVTLTATYGLDGHRVRHRRAPRGGPGARLRRHRRARTSRASSPTPAATTPSPSPRAATSS